MEYRHFAPPQDLAPWVKCLWILRGSLPEDGRLILPDGRIELVFDLSAGSHPPPSLIAGQMMSAFHLRSNGPMESLGLCLHTHASSLLVPAVALGGEVHCLEAVLGDWARTTRERLGASDTEAQRLAIACESLRSLLACRRRPGQDAAIAHSVRAIQAAKGRGAIDRFRPDGLGTRQWQRRFFRDTGLTPKSFARIVRLQRLVALYEARAFDNCASLALECGYYDQAHLTNEFRGFTGLSPRQFFGESRGMTAFFRDDAFFQDERRPAKVDLRS